MSEEKKTKASYPWTIRKRADGDQKWKTVKKAKTEATILKALREMFPSDQLEMSTRTAIKHDKTLYVLFHKGSRA
jgi:hypothetical protein